MTQKNSIKKAAAFPFSPSAIPVYYGWIILVMGIVGVWISLPGQTMGVSVFTDDLIRVLDLSRVNLSLAYMIGTIVSAVILTPAGKSLDKYGARVMGTIAVFLLGLLLIGMSGLEDCLNLLITLIPLPPRVIAFILISLSFFLLRFLGQGMVTLISKNMVMKWFDAYRGRANAVLGVCISFGFSLTPRFLNDMVQTRGWDGAWRYLGIGIITGGTLAFFLIGRDNPFDCGMKPDSRKEVKQKKSRPPSHPEKSFTLKEARRTLPFWVLGLTLTMHSLYITAFTFHIVSIFESVGMTRAQAIGIFLPASFLSITANFVGSWLSDFIRIRYILLVQQASLLSAMFFISRVAPGFSYVMIIISYGITLGLFNITNSIVWPRYYGIEHLGAITGQIMGLMVAGSAVGPYFFSIIRKYTGSYSAASLICLAALAVLFILGIKVRRPSHPEEAPQKSL